MPLLVSSMKIIYLDIMIRKLNMHQECFFSFWFYHDYLSLLDDGKMSNAAYFFRTMILREETELLGSPSLPFTVSFHMG